MLTRLQRDELKGIADIAFKRAGGNLACSTISRIDRVATFSDYVNLEIENRAVPLDVAIDVDAYNLSRPGGRAWLIEAAARFLGFELVRRPAVGAQAAQVDGLIRSAKESAEAISAGWEALADSVVTAKERDEINRQFDQAVVAFLEAKAAFNAGEGEE